MEDRPVHRRGAGRQSTFEELVFWQIYDRHVCTREDLCELFDVSAATISRAVCVLLEHGLVTEQPAHTTGPGRKPRLLEIDRDLARLAGLEIRPDRVTAVIADLSGRLLGRGAVECEAWKGIDAVMAPARRALTTAVRDAGVRAGEIQVLGVGHPGDLDLESGICRLWAGAPAWRDTPIRRPLEENFCLPVILDDCSRAHALAERRTCREDGRHPNALYIITDYDVGMGIFIHGRLYRGATRGGGEIAHITIDPAGPLCTCGNRGCVQAFLRQAADAFPGNRASSSATDSILSEPGRAGSGKAGAIEALGIAIANAVQLFNPSLVVLSGKLARAAGRAGLERIRAILAERCVPTAHQKLEIRLAPPKKDITAVGCALLTVEEVLGELLDRKIRHAEQESAPGHMPDHQKTIRSPSWTILGLKRNPSS